MNERELAKGLARLQAIQDQEIAAAADWIRKQAQDECGRQVVEELFAVLNDRNVESLRACSDQALIIVCNLAMIGLGMAIQSFVEAGGGKL